MDTTTVALRWKTAREWACVLAGLLVITFVATEASAAAASQKTFASPEDAANALVQAVKSRDRTATIAVLGNAGEWMSSGDETADRSAAERFVAAYEAKHAIAKSGRSLLIEARPGLGRSAMLDAAALLAKTLGARVLRANASATGPAAFRLAERLAAQRSSLTLRSPRRSSAIARSIRRVIR